MLRSVNNSLICCCNPYKRLYVRHSYHLSQQKAQSNYVTGGGLKKAHMFFGKSNILFSDPRDIECLGCSYFNATYLVISVAVKKLFSDSTKDVYILHNTQCLVWF